jgi:translocation and assembly module TamB
MRRLNQIVLRMGAGIAVLVVAALIAGMLVFRSGWFHERVRERIVFEIQKATGARVDFGSFAFDWTHLSATAGPVVLHGREPANEPPLIAIKSVVIGLRVISMLERKVDLSTLRIEQPVVHLVFYPDGSTNIPPHRETDWVEDIFNIAVRRYEVDDGVLEYDDRKIPLNLRGENLRAAMSHELRASRYKGELTSRHVRAMIAGLPPIELDTTCAFILDKSKIELTQLRIATRQSRADLSGVLNDPRAPHGTLSIKSSISIREAADFFQLPIGRNGSATFDGQLSVSFTDPFQFGMNGRMNARGLGYTRDRLKIEGAEAHAEVRLTPQKLTLNGIALKALGATVAGAAELDNWSRLHFDGNIGGLTVRDAARIATDRQIPWNGALAGGFSVDAVLGKPTAKVQVAVGIVPLAGATPVEGQIDAAYDQASGKLRLDNFHVATATSSLDASGTLGETLSVRAQSTSLDDVMSALSMAGQSELPVKLAFARATFNGNVAGALDDPNISGDATVANASIDGHGFDRFTGKIQVNRRSIRADQAKMVRGPTEVEGSATLTPPERNGAIAGELQIRGAQIAELSKEAGIDPVISGTAAATVKFSGTVSQPEAEIALQIEKPAGLGEQVDRLRANLHYSPTAINVVSGDAQAGAGKMQFQGAFQHRDGDWKNGEVRFEAGAQGIVLTSVKAYAALQTGVDSRIDGKATGTARLVNGELVLSTINGDAAARGVTWSGQTLGDVNITANTRAAELAVHASAKIRDVAIDAQGSWKLEGDYPGSAALQFSRANVATLHNIVMIGGPAEQTELPFEGFIDGANAKVTVALRKPRDFQAELTVPVLQINPKSTQTLRLGVQPQDLVIKNSAPVVAGISMKEARIRSAKFTARDSSLEFTGAIPLDRSGADLSVRGSVNLIILQLLNPDLAARGNATVQASIRGTLRDPLLSGRMDLKNASLYLSDLPNGVDNANGTLLFDRNRATIEKLTAETGGGTIDFTGFVGFGAPLVYRLQAVAQKVRVRYPEDVSVTFNASLALNGTSDASTVSGVVTLTRASFTPRADLAQILAQASKPVPTTAPNDYIRGTQFDVRIESGPNFELQTSLTRNLEGEIDLRLRGTPLRPALLGTASVNAGDIQVFGNRYTVNRGDVRFVNPVRIDPILDMDLETKARGVTVNIAISGTMQKLNVNYSSDPPMQPREIIALLAVGRAPADTAGLSPENSPATSNSLAEAGGGLIGQAITAQLSSRLQRFFGASRVKIDPTVTGVDYLPQARLTIEQQVSKDVTLTYITNLNRTQEQIVQVEWDFSKQWSAVAVREANGLFGIDFQYKKRFK